MQRVRSPPSEKKWFSQESLKVLKRDDIELFELAEVSGEVPVS